MKADGTAVEADKEDKDTGEGAHQDVITAKQTVVPYSVYLEASRGASLKQVADSDSEKGVYVFEVVSDKSDYQAEAGKVTFRYTDLEGKAGSGTAEFDSETKRYTVKLSGLSIQPGSKVSIKLEGTADGDKTEGKYLVSNPITVDATTNGAVNLSGGETGSGVYLFKIAPAVGYTVKSGSPYIRYTNTNGETVKKALPSAAASGTYSLKLSDLPGLASGSGVTVGAEFEENFKTVTTTMQAAGKPNSSAGSFTDMHGTEGTRAKVGEKVSFKLAAGSGHEGQMALVTLRYRLSGAEQDTVKVLQADGDGKFDFIMPNANVTLIADFFNQIHEAKVAAPGASDAKVNITSAGAGETITVSLNETAQMEGKKITGVKLNVKNKATSAPITAITLEKGEDGKWSYTVPQTLNGVNLEETACVFSFDPSFAEKTFIVKTGAVENGTIKLSSTMADPGETYTFTVTPNSGFTLSEGSVTVSITTGGSTTSLPVKGSGTKFSVVMPSDLTASAKAEIRAGFEIGVPENVGSGKDGEEVYAMGAAVAVGVTYYNNTARLDNADVTAKSLSLTSNTETTGKVDAVAGYNKADFGLGGAIAVQVAAHGSEALVDKDAKLSLQGGKLSVSAESKNQFDTTANAKGKQSSKVLGVGAGIAVSATGVETTARIADEVEIQLGEKALSGVEIKATASDKQKVNATAGAAGGFSGTPSVAVMTAGAKTLAQLGKGSGVLRCTGDLTVAATSTLDRILNADAASAGGGVGVGASVGVTVFHDSTVARLSRSAKAKNVSVKTSAKNRELATAKAGTNGASSDGKSSDGKDGSDPAGGKNGKKSGADKQADNALSKAGKAAGKVNTAGVSKEKVSQDAKNKPSASTAEGGIEIAAALVLNIQTIEALAQIDDGVTITAEAEKAADGATADAGEKTESKDKGGAVTVQSLACNESTVTANGSASKGKVGVGVAVALNQVEYANEALLGDSAVTAEKLTVEAGLLPNGTKDKTVGKNEKYDPEKDRNWLMKLLEDAVTELVMDIADSMGLADLLGESNAEIISRIVTDTVDAALNELVKGTGLEDLLKNDPYEQFKDNLGELKDMFTALPDDLKKKLGLDEDADWSDALESGLSDYLKDDGWNLVQDKLLDKLLEAVNPSMLNFLDPSSILNGTESFLEQIKNAFNVDDGFFSETFDKLVDDLKDKIKAITGKDDVSMDSIGEWVEESLDKLVDKSVDKLAEGIIDLDTFKAFIADRLGEVLVEKLVSAVEEGGKALTNAAVAEILGHLNREYTIEGEINAHCFTTQAIAGASAGTVSVADSAAVALIDGETSALIAGAVTPSDKLVKVSGDVKIRAAGSQVEKTTASAAEDGRGNADGNLNAGAGDSTEEVAETKASSIDTISNAAIEVGAGGSASVSDRKVTLKPDSNKKVRGVTVKYVKPDGSTGTMEISLSDGAFTVPEISKDGESVSINLGGKDVEVKAGSKLSYTVVFVGKETVFAGDVNLSWKGEGSAELSKETVDSETEDYSFKITPKAGYMLDKTLTFKYIKSDGKTGEKTVELTDAQLTELVNNGFHFQLVKKDGETRLVLSAIEQLKPETLVDVSLRFIGKNVLAVQDGEVAETPKPNADGSYTNTYKLKDGSKEAVTVKLMNLRAQKDGEELHAATGERVTMIVKPAEGYSIDKMKLLYKLEGEDRTRDVVTLEPSVVDPDGGTAYIFTMPGSDAKLQFVFSESTPGEKEDEEKTQKGMSIGAGAAFAMTYADLSVVAGIGDNRSVTAGTADIGADAVHNTQTAAVAGTDPLANAKGETNKKVALDASAAVTVVDDEIKATVGEGSTLTLNGKNTIINEADPKSPLNFRLSAERESKSITKASAFAAGKKTAVGASVAVNITSSAVLAALNGSVSAAGAADLHADDFSRDNSEALATAMGADLDRYLSKFAKDTESTEKKANKLLVGRYFDDDEAEGKDKEEQTENGKKINETLEDKNGSDKTTDGKANLSSNALRSQDVKSDAGDDAADEAKKGTDEAGAESGENLAGAAGTAEQKFQVAASVGLNITEHRAKVAVKGALSASSIAVRANNRGNFMTKASGAAMSMEQNSNSIAAGVAVAVNRNESTVDVYGDLTAKDAEGKPGEVSLDAFTTKNMDGKYRGLLAAQSLSGAVAGGKVSINGSVSVLTDDSVTAVRLHSTASEPVTVEGGALRFQAWDKSKLAIRAGGASVSTGGNVGAGAAFALVYANSVVDASVGDAACIRGSSLEICAQKAVVDYSDFESAVGVDTFITDTSEVDAADKDKIDKGIVNLDRDKSDPKSSYKVDINFTTADVVELVDALNVLSSTNYYLEAVAGAIVSNPADDSDAAVAGSVAMLFFANKVTASLGDAVTVELSGQRYELYRDVDDRAYYILSGAVYAENDNGTLSKTTYTAEYFGVTPESEKETIDGVDYKVYKVGDRSFYVYGSRSYEKVGEELKRSDVPAAVLQGRKTGESVELGLLLNAMDDSNVRILAGSLEVAPSKAGVGLTLAWMDNDDQAAARVGDDSTVSIEKGGYTQNAQVNVNGMILTVAAAISSGSSSTLNLGGTVNVLSADSRAESTLGSNSSVTAADDVTINSGAETDVLLVSVSAAPGGAKVAVGGTVAVVLDSVKALTELGQNAAVRSTGGSVALGSANHEKILNILASASAAGSPSSEASVAGSIGVLVSATEAKVRLGDKAAAEAKDDVALTTDISGFLVEVCGALAIGGGTAEIGATVLATILKRSAGVSLGEKNKVTAERGSVLIESVGEDFNVLVGLAAGGTTGNAFNGTVPVLVSRNAVVSELGKGSSIAAGDSIGVISKLDTENYVFAGGLTVALGTVGLGASVGTVVLHNTVASTIAQSAKLTARVRAGGTGLATATNRSAKRRGVMIEAAAKDTAVVGCVAAGGASTAGVSASVVTLVIQNKVKAEVQSGTEIAAFPGYGEEGEGDVAVGAEDHSDVWAMAGALAVGGTAGVGATVVTVVFGKSVEAGIAEHCFTRSAGGVSVGADDKSRLVLLAVGFGAAGTAGVAGDVSTMVYTDRSAASLGGSVRARKNVSVTADSDNMLVNVALGVAAGGTAGVTAVAVVTYFQGTTLAEILDEAEIGGQGEKIGGSVSVLANSAELVTGDAAGAAGGGAAGVGGAVDVIVTKLHTRALTRDKVKIFAQGDLTVSTIDSYELVAVVATLAVAGTAGVGISVLVSVSYAEVAAVLGDNNRIEARNVSVLARDDREIITADAALAGAGAVGVSAAVSVVVAGAKMSQDAHDTIYDNSEVIDGDTYHTYYYDTTVAGEKQTVKLFEKDGSYYYYNDSNVLVSYPGAVDSAKLRRGGLDPRTQMEASFASGSGAAAEFKPDGDELDALLEGDGQTASGDDYSEYGQPSGEVDPVLGDGQLYILKNGAYVAITDEQAAGEYSSWQRYWYDSEHDTYVETEATSAGSFDTSGYDDTANGSDGTSYEARALTGLADANTARISAGTQVKALGDIRVTADDTLNVLLISGSLGIGGAAGVGVGVTVATLYSNVRACVDEGAVLSASGDITVRASAGSAEKDIEESLDRLPVGGENPLTGDMVRSSNNKANTDSGTTATKSTIRLISVTAAGGIAGVGVSVSVLQVYSEAEASLRGSVTAAQNLNVLSHMEFGRVLTVNVGAAGGLVGVNASVALTYFAGSAKAGIYGTGSIRNVKNAIRVKTAGTTKAMTAAGTLAGGLVAVNVGVAKAVNRTTVRSTVARGVTVDAPEADMTVAHDFHNEARAVIVSVGGGLVGVGVTVTIVINKLDAASAVGEGSGAGSIRAKSLTVSGSADGDAKVTNVGVTLGGVAVNASVSLAMNYAANVAKVEGMPIALSGDMAVTAVLTGEAEVNSTAITAGLVSVGASVNVAKINSRNEALVLLGGDISARSLRIDAGTAGKPNNPTATVLGITGNAGGVAVNVNVGLAYNAGENRAKLGGSGNITLSGNGGTALAVRANGRGRTHTALYSAALGGVSVNVSVALAWLRNTQEAVTELNGAVSVADNSAVEVVSVQNGAPGSITGKTFHGADGNSRAVSFGDTMASATLFTAGVGLASISASSVTAWSDCTNRAALALSALRCGDVLVKAGGCSSAKSETEQVSLGVVAVGVVVGRAIAAGRFEAELAVNGGEAEVESLSIENNFSSDASCHITPAAAGVDAALYNNKVNVALASNTTRVHTGMGGGGTVKARGAVAVTSLGSSYAEAQVHTPVVTLAGIKVVVNVSAAVNRTRQITELDGLAVEAASMRVRSALNSDDALRPGSSAVVGGMADREGVSLTLVNGEASVALADFRAVNEVWLDRFASNITGALEVLVEANSIAKADVEVASQVSLFSVSLTVVKSYAKGSFSAMVNTRDRKLRAGSVKVNTSYNANAWAETAVATKGVSASLLNIGVNVALADASPSAGAGVAGSGGEVETDEDSESEITVVGTGLAHADVKTPLVSISGINIAANVALAQLKGAQRARIESVSFKGGSVRVDSAFNAAMGSEVAAEATIGAGGQSAKGFSLAGIDVKANTVVAKADFVTEALVNNSSFDLSGELSVFAHGSAVAHAGIRKTGSSIALLGIGVMVSQAHADGSFNAVMTNCGDLKAAALSVRTEYTAASTAETTQPTGGITLALLDVNTNISKARVGAHSRAAVEGSGSLVIAGNAEILAAGTINANAEAAQAGVSLTAVKVTVNEVESHLCAEQEARLALSGDASSVGGTLRVDSTISGGSSQAVTEGSAGGADLHLVGVEVNKAEAHSTTASSAGIEGGVYTVGQLRLNAVTAPSVKADARTGNFSLGLVTVGSLSAKSFSQDSVTVTLNEADVTVLDGDAQITGSSNVNSYAHAEKGGQIAVVTVTISKALAQVGAGAEDRQTVTVTVRGASLKAKGDILIRAHNAGKAEAVIEKGWTVSAVDVDRTSLPTESYFRTGVSVIDGALLRSEEGGITVLSEDAGTARSVAKGTNIGFLVDAEYTKGENTIHTNNTLRVLATMSAYEALDILGRSSVTMVAQTEADGGGFFTGKTLRAYNSLYRTVSVEILDGSDLSADYGDLHIRAIGGEDDWIVTWTKISSGGVVALGNTKSEAVNSSFVSVKVGQARIYDRYNTVCIQADAKAPLLHTTAYSNCSGLGVHPEAYAYNTLLFFIIAEVSGQAPGSDGAVIEARHVRLNSLVSEMDVYAMTVAKGKALGANVDAKSVNDVKLYATVTVTNADITGHDSTAVYASTRPAFEEKNLYSESRIQLDAIGDGYARSYIDRTFHTDTYVNSGVIFRGAQLTVTAYEFELERLRNIEHTGGFIRKHSSSGGTNELQRNVVIADGTVLYVGDAAAGIHFDISIYHGALLIRQVGVKREAVIWTVAGKDISFAPIRNELPGYVFLHDATSIGALTVYDQAWIPAVTFTNRTDNNIILSHITTRNVGYILPRVITRDTAPASVDLRKHPALSDLLVENWLTGGVRVEGFLPFYNGTVEFCWIGETGGALTACEAVTDVDLAGETGDVLSGLVAPIWAHALRIVNAASVGLADGDVRAWVVANRGESAQVLDGSVDVSASGDIHLLVKPLIAEVVAAADMPESGAMGDPSPDDSRVDIHSVESTAGSVYLTLDMAGRLYIQDDTVTVAIPVPGTVSYVYTVGSLSTLSADAVLDGMAVLERYLQSYDPITDAYSYLLPNGALLILDGEGNVLRIEEAGTAMNVGSYVFHRNGSGKVTGISLGEGVEIDLETGEINVQDGASYELLLSALLGDRFLALLKDHTISIRIVQSDYTENADGTLTLNSAVEREVSLVKLASNDQFNGYANFPRNRFVYYYFSGMLPSADKLLGGETSYLVVHDTDAAVNSVRLYALDSMATQESGDYSNDWLHNRTELVGGEYVTPDMETVTINGRQYYKVDAEYPVIRASGEYWVQNFLGTGIDVYIFCDGVDRIYLTRLEPAFYDPERIVVWPDTTAAHDLYVMNLGNGMYTVPTELGHEFDPTNPADVFWQKLQGKIWSYEERASILTETRQTNSMGGGYMKPTLTANAPDGKNFLLALNVDGVEYGLETTLYQYELLIHFTDLIEVSASLSGEYDASGLSYDTDTPGYEYREEAGSKYIYKTADQERDAVVSEEIVPEATGEWCVDHAGVRYTWTAADRLTGDAAYDTFRASCLSESESGLDGSGKASNVSYILVRIAKTAAGEDDTESLNRLYPAQIVRYKAETGAYELVEDEVTAMQLFEDNGRRRVRTENGLDYEYRSTEPHEYATAADIASAKLVLRMGTPEDGAAPMLSVEGPVLNVLKARPQQLSTSQYDGLAYQISPTLYLTENGRVLSVNGSFSAVYDGTAYRSDKTLASELGTPGETQGNQPRVTVRAGEKIYKEQLSDHIATDLNGRYYYSADGETAWVLIPDADVLAGLGSYAYTDRSGQPAVIPAAVLTHDGADTVEATVVRDGISYLTITRSPDGVLYYTIPVFDGGKVVGFVRAGSDGTVERLGDQPAAQVLTDTPGVDYLLTSVSAAEEVVITILDENAHLVDNDPAGSDGLDINVGSDGHPGSLTFVTDGGEGSIGEPDNDIEVDTHGGPIGFETLDGEGSAKNDTYIYIPQNDVTLKPLVLDDAKLQLVTGNGSIEGGDVTVVNGGTGIFYTDRDDDPPHNTERDHDAAPAEGNIRFGTVTVDGNSSLTIEGRGDVTIGDASVTDNSQLNVASSEGDFHGEDLGVTDGSAASIQAAQDAELYQIRSVDGSVTISAGADLRFDNAIVRRSELTLAAATRSACARAAARSAANTASATSSRSMRTTPSPPPASPSARTDSSASGTTA